MQWKDLAPDENIVAALDHAGDRDEGGDQNIKRKWSERFANGCAIAVADGFRSSALRKKRILPESLEGGTEPLTPLGAGTEKRIDVTVADAVLGLEIGVSLKGLNFEDSRALNYDKNLTGRLYELGDEVRVVHEHLPHAFMVGVFFLPIQSTDDKKSSDSQSSFTRTVLMLRNRTGRLDPSLPGQAGHCDAAYVALYTHSNEGGLPRGLCRVMNIGSAPPFRGRPRVETTLSLSEMVTEIVQSATFSHGIEYADPEDDS